LESAPSINAFLLKRHKDRLWCRSQTPPKEGTALKVHFIFFRVADETGEAMGEGRVGRRGLFRSPRWVDSLEVKRAGLGTIRGLAGVASIKSIRRRVP
jgi:hypothetical protein